MTDAQPVSLEPGVELRRATSDDLDAIVTIKRSLPMPRGAQTQDGGFLLGSELETYRELLAVARVWLLEVDGAAAGFSIALDDAVLRASPIWARRDAIRWEPSFDLDAALGRRIAYFDQLALLGSVRRRYWGAALALRALMELFDERGHDLVLTTTVIEPIVNRSALPFLDHVGATRQGRIEEHYPGAGRVVSDVHVIAAERYRAHVRGLALGRPLIGKIVELLDLPRVRRGSDDWHQP